MSDVYNPESRWAEKLETLRSEASRLAERRSQMSAGQERDVVDQQIQELTHQITRLRELMRDRRSFASLSR